MVIRIENDDGTSTFLLNGKEELYRGKYNSWQINPQGVLIILNNSDGTFTILLNGKEELYAGKKFSFFR
jgi:hypothetical protein